MKRILLLALVIGSGTAWADAFCGSNGKLVVNPFTNSLECTGKTGPAGYIATFSSQTGITVTAATHGQGTQPFGSCWDNATPANQIALTANYPTVAANGDMVFAWTGSKSGYCLISALGNQVGPAGATGAAGAAGAAGTTLADSTVIYVSATGNDSNSGAGWAAPKASLGGAIAALPTTGSPAIHYGTVYMGPGTFTENGTMPIEFNAEIHLVCASSGDGGFAQGTVIKLGNGKNSALLSYTGAFASANGYAHFAQIENCTFDGNAANNASTANGTGLVQVYNGGFQASFKNVQIQNAAKFGLKLQNSAVNFSCYTCTFSADGVGATTGNGGAVVLNSVAGGNNIGFYDTQIDNSGPDPIYISQTDTGGSNIITFTNLKTEATSGTTNHQHVIRLEPNGGHPMVIAIRGANFNHTVGSGATYPIYEDTGTGPGAYWVITGAQALGDYTSTFNSAKTGQTSFGANYVSFLNAGPPVTSADGVPILDSVCPLMAGSGSPNSVVTANPCAMYLATGGGSGTTLYVKESGSATNTGWGGYGSGGGGGSVTTTGSPTSGQGTFMSGASSITSSPNWTYNASTGHFVTQGANNVDALGMKRFTDTVPSGNFLHFQNAAAASDMFKLDVAGNIVTAGTVSSSVGASGAGGALWQFGTQSLTPFSAVTNGVGWLAAGSGSGQHAYSLPATGSGANQFMLFGAESAGISPVTMTGFTSTNMTDTANLLYTNASRTLAAALSVGTGGSIGPTGTGTINANQLAGTSVTAMSGTGTTVPLTTSPVLTTPHVTTIDDGNGNPFITSTATASAVDSVTVTNAAAANPATVRMAATGSDTNIIFELKAKGTGTVNLGSPNATVDSSGNLVVTGCTGCGGGGGGSSVGSQSSSLTFTGLVDGACADQTFAFTGITTATQLTAGFPSALPAGVDGVMFASAAATVDVRMCNHSGGSQTFGPLTYTAKIANYYLTGNSTFTWSAIPDGSCRSQTFTLTGATAGDPVVPGWPAAFDTGLEGSMLISAGNTVQVRVCNYSGGSVTPGNTESFVATIAK